jgi:hypothetical protein
MQQIASTNPNAITRTLVAAVALVVAASSTSLAEDPIRPDPKLTPGAVVTTDTAVICVSGYTKSVRHTSGHLKALIYREYGIDRDNGHYEIDHLIPLSIGGADEAANLWPQSYDTRPWNAKVKDRLEEYLHQEVCGGRMPLERAQKEIAADWIAAYERYLGLRQLLGRSAGGHARESQKNNEELISQISSVFSAASSSAFPTSSAPSQRIGSPAPLLGRRPKRCSLYRTS